MKTCSRCGESKDRIEFSYREDRLYRSTVCRSCVSAIRKSYHLSPRGQQAYKHTLARSYGITGRQYAKLLHEQNGLCAICGYPKLDRRKADLAIDHSHKTGKVRGLLCTNCNNGLGLFKEDPSLIASAIAYLS